MRSILFAIGFHAFALGIGLWVHPGAGLAVWGLGVCTPLALARVLGVDAVPPAEKPQAPGVEERVVEVPPDA